VPLGLRRGGRLLDIGGLRRVGASQDSLYHDKQRIKESVEINESLYALKRCIRASRAVRRWKARGGFSNPDNPTPAPPPFRGSALTRVLREAFVSADACLSVVATVSPSATDAEHTVSTLRTVCELAGTSRAAEAASDPKPRTVPKLRHGEVARPGPRLPVSRHPPSSQTSSALPPFPNKWSSSRLAAFLATRCHLSQAADRALKIFRWTTHLAHERAGRRRGVAAGCGEREAHRRQAADGGREVRRAP